ncbi:glycine zipper 2TM domain-containing protein [Amphritea pacifica]|uniref:Glycine zipper 2TM domain-containing protein n=1 Tax=Amphritea pacifica TaxID=2811233 RepID=A0ABS2WA60_9GAMM|nr:glycine zipper 2TM domain-containing protein [Amphritea pacifica]MBN0988468.1 glycine zipper 2TM domain-containing protein [Amphritea pacifica]MBN1007938.1 glycine zipper 2TM domain-containing protein [Amphritea pacifica]
MKKIIAGSLILLGLASGMAQADPRFKEKRHHQEFARVTHVEPIVVQTERRIPRRECWEEDVRYETPAHHRKSYTGPILGGIIGGAIGNELGAGQDNKKVGAVVGAVLGASIGNDISRNSHHRGNNVEYRTETRCNVQHDIEYYERVTGYKVTYRYNGQTYQTRMDHDPGDRIRVRVSVSPVS